MTRPLIGRPTCKYCSRELSATHSTSGTAFTLDHVKAKADGGFGGIRCCRACNMLKADLAMADWFWFIGAFQRWWKTFDTPAQVLSQVRAEHRRRAYANAGVVK